jgi:hypothetical protein
MNNIIKTEEPKTETTVLLENYEDEYWAKKYGVSSEDLKKSDRHIGISAKIIAANFKNKSYSI